MVFNCFTKLNTTPETVILLVPQEFGGENIIGISKNGKTKFNGHSANAMITAWNAPKLCSSNDGLDSDTGLQLSKWGENNEGLDFPLRIVNDTYLQQTGCTYETFEDTLLHESQYGYVFCQ